MALNFGVLKPGFSSCVVPAFPYLSFTQEMLGESGFTIHLPPASKTVQVQGGTIPVMFISGEASADFLITKTLPIATLYLAQISLTSAIGDIILTTDATNMLPIRIKNCSITANDYGNNAGGETITLTLSGYITLNELDQL